MEDEDVRKVGIVVTMAGKLVMGWGIRSINSLFYSDCCRWEIGSVLVQFCRNKLDINVQLAPTISFSALHFT